MNDPRPVEVVKEEIDPALAKELLANCIVNRPLSYQRILAYADEMRQGLWSDNGETIKLTEDGRLGDGFHRMNAVVESGTTQVFSVAYNVPLEAILKTVDAGRPRSVVDALSMLGVENYTALGSSARLLIQYYDRLNGVPERVQKAGVTRQKVLNFLEENPELNNYVAQAQRIYVHIGVPLSVVLTALYLTRDHPKWIEFWGGIESGAGLGINDPRRHVVRLGLGLERRRRSNRLHLLFLVLKAFNKFVNDEEVQILFYRTDEAIPVVEMPNDE